MFEQSASLFHEVGELWGAAHIVWGLSHTARRQGRYAQARTLNREAIPIQIGLKSWVGIPYTLESLAYIDAAERQPERAARLLAAAQKMREQQGAFSSL